MFQVNDEKGTIKDENKEFLLLPLSDKADCKDFPIAPYISCISGIFTAVRLTGENGPPFTLLLDPSLLLSRHSERRLEHKAPDVVTFLEVSLPVLQLLVV